MQCPAELHLQSYFDGELDVNAAADLERHLEQCPKCRLHLDELRQLKDGLAQQVPYLGAPPALRARILTALDQESLADEPPAVGTRRSRRIDRQYWLGLASGLAAAAAIAAVAILIARPAGTGQVAEQLVAAHVSSLMSAHLIDVASTDQHTVKPWFAGRTEVSPVVADFETQGYKLVGGRIDYIDRQRAAVVIYQHGPHVINVFSWLPGNGALPDRMTRNGYHLAFWKSGNLEYCAVSDTAWGELLALAGLLQNLGSQDLH